MIVKINGDLIAGLPVYESGIQLLCLHPDFRGKFLAEADEEIAIFVKYQS